VSFELTILGSSSALPTSKRFPTAHLLQVDERFFLIDCGEGTQMQLRRYGFNPGRIHHIFISHLHGDHVFGLFGLLSTMGMLGRRAPLHLYGPEKLEALLLAHFKWFAHPPFEIRFMIPVEAAGVPLLDDGKMEVHAFRLDHRVETWGFLFREKPRALNVIKEAIGRWELGVADVVKVKRGEDHVTPDGEVIPNRELTHPPYHRRSYAHVSDTLFYPAIYKHIRGVDLLFHEATFSEEHERLAAETKHATASQAARIALEAGAGKLLIGHFSSRYRDPDMLVDEARSVFPETEGVSDGDVHSLPRRRIRRE
jgi:ribonuclease Z